MIIRNLLKAVSPSRIKTSVSAGKNDTVTSTAIDTIDFGAALFRVTFGAIVSGGTGTVKLQHSSDNGSSDAFADIAGSGYAYTDADATKMVLIDVDRPTKRYIQVVVVRNNDQNATIDSIDATLYQPTYTPIASYAASVASAKTLGNAYSGAA